jgi:hypothetical protein
MVKSLRVDRTPRRPTATAALRNTMTDTELTTPARLADGAVSYEGVQVVITREAPDHYSVTVRERDGTVHSHAVERVVVNTGEVHLADSVWFVDVKVDVGVPATGHGDVVWVWA